MDDLEIRGPGWPREEIRLTGAIAGHQGDAVRISARGDVVSARKLAVEQWEGEGGSVSGLTGCSRSADPFRRERVGWRQRTRAGINALLAIVGVLARR